MQSKQLSKLESIESTGTQVVVNYTRLDGDSPKPGMKGAMFKDSISDDIKAKLKSMKPGDEFVMVKTKMSKNGKDYWNMTGIEEASSYSAKPKQSFQKGGYEKKSFDSNGARIGGLTHDVVAIAVARKTTSLEQMKGIGDEMIELINYIEAKHSGKVPPPSEFKSKPQYKDSSPELEEEFSTDDDSYWNSSE